MASPTAHSLHLLSIDLRSAPSSLRAALEFCREDVEHWLKRAAAASAPLAIVCGPESVDLYSTECGRRAAFKPLLESLWSLGRNLEGVDRVRTTEASGHSVVRHLLRQAAGLESTEHGLSYASCIAEAWELAAEHGTLSDALCELFRLAHTTADRSHTETELGAPSSTRASRQVEALSAERIMEEELMAFQVAAANDVRASVAPSVVSTRPSSLLPAYTPSEPGSSVRIRISPFSLAPVSQRRIG
jgi:glutamyl-tRNA reductase